MLGHITALYGVTCGICNACSIHGMDGPLTAVRRILRDAGWEHTWEHGWICENCTTKPGNTP